MSSGLRALQVVIEELHEPDGQIPLVREPRQVVPLVWNVPAKPGQAHPALSGPGVYSGLGRDTKR